MRAGGVALECARIARIARATCQPRTPPPTLHRREGHLFTPPYPPSAPLSQKERNEKNPDTPARPAPLQSVFHVAHMRGLFPDSAFKAVDMKNLDSARWRVGDGAGLVGRARPGRAAPPGRLLLQARPTPTQTLPQTPLSQTCAS